MYHLNVDIHFIIQVNHFNSVSTTLYQVLICVQAMPRMGNDSLIFYVEHDPELNGVHYFSYLAIFITSYISYIILFSRHQYMKRSSGDLLQERTERERLIRKTTEPGCRTNSWK